MKLRKNDTVMVITGRDKGKTGKVLAVVPNKNAVVVEGVNIVKRHTKPSNSNPKGGILDITKAIDASKVMVVDPKSGKPARISYQVTSKGEKQRIYKVGKRPAPAKPKKEANKAEQKTDKKGKE